MPPPLRGRTVRRFGGEKSLRAKTAPRYPMNMEREYVRMAGAYAAIVYESCAKRLPEIRRAVTAERNGGRLDGLAELRSFVSKKFLDIQAAFEKKAGLFHLEWRLSRLANLGRKLSVYEWKRAVSRTLGVNILEDHYKGEHYRRQMRAWAERNAGLIKTIPKDALAAMQSIVQDGITNGTPTKDIGKAIQAEYGACRKKARALARDQCAKLNADLTEAQHREAGIEKYAWSSSGDSRVRKSHAELDGKTFGYDAPPVVDERTGRRAHPGRDFQCRCAALPVFDVDGLDLPWDGRH